jgi:hypothetical protein
MNETQAAIPAISISEMAQMITRAVNSRLPGAASHDGGDVLIVTTPATGQVFRVTVEANDA